MMLIRSPLLFWIITLTIRDVDVSDVPSKYLFRIRKGTRLSVYHQFSGRKYNTMSTDFRMFPLSSRKACGVVYYIYSLVHQRFEVNVAVCVGSTHDAGDHDYQFMNSLGFHSEHPRWPNWLAWSLWNWDGITLLSSGNGCTYFRNYFF